MIFQIVPINHSKRYKVLIKTSTTGLAANINHYDLITWQCHSHNRDHTMAGLGLSRMGMAE